MDHAAPAPTLEDIVAFMATPEKERENGHGSAARKLIAAASEAGGDLDERTDAGRTLLCESLRSRLWEAAALLLRLGADPDLADGQGAPPLALCLDIAAEAAYSDSEAHRACSELLMSGASRSDPLIDARIDRLARGSHFPATAWGTLSDDELASSPGWSAAAVAKLRSAPLAAAMVRELASALNSNPQRTPRELGGAMSMIGRALQAPDAFSDTLIFALSETAERGFPGQAALGPARPDAPILATRLATPSYAAALEFNNVAINLAAAQDLLDKAHSLAPGAKLDGPVDLARAQRLAADHETFQAAHPGACAALAIECLSAQSIGKQLKDEDHESYPGSAPSLGKAFMAFFRTPISEWPDMAAGAEAFMAKALPTFTAFARHSHLRALAGLQDPMTDLSCELLIAMDVESSPSNSIAKAGEALAELGLSKAGWKKLAKDPECRRLMREAIGEAKAGAKRRAAESSFDRFRAPRRREMAIMGMLMPGDEPNGPRGGGPDGAPAASGLDEKARHALRASCQALSLGCEASGSEARMPELLLALTGASKSSHGFFTGSMPAYSMDFSRGAARMDFRPDELISEALAFGKLHKTLALGLARAMEAELAKGSFEGAVGHAKARIVEIFDCAKGMPPGFWASLDPKDPYSNAKRAHRDWVDQMNQAKIKADPTLLDAWEPLIETPAPTPGVQVRELLAKMDLHLEGQQQSHCVLSYADRCQSGRSRIFSLTAASGERSTLELSPSRSEGWGELDFDSLGSRTDVQRWTIQQHLGKHNGAVKDPALLAAAPALAAAATAQFNAKTLAMAVAEQARKAAEAAAEQARKAAEAAAAQERQLADISAKKAQREEAAAKAQKPAAPEAWSLRKALGKKSG